MRHLFLVLLCFITVFLAGCNTHRPNKEETLERLGMMVNHWGDSTGVDLILSIISIKETPTTKDYVASSFYNGKKVGFLISIPKNDKGENGFATGMELRSTGIESDNFLEALMLLYERKPLSDAKFVQRTSINFLNVREFANMFRGQERIESVTELNDYKLFFGKEDSQYAEVYININETTHWLEFKEKDPAYRTMLIHFLTQHN